MGGLDHLGVRTWLFASRHTCMPPEGDCHAWVVGLGPHVDSSKADIPFAHAMSALPPKAGICPLRAKSGHPHLIRSPHRWALLLNATPLDLPAGISARALGTCSRTAGDGELFRVLQDVSGSTLSIRKRLKSQR